MLNFAGDFKKIKSEPVKKTNHLFDISADFKYSTQYANRLDKKSLVVTVMQKNSFMADEPIGQASVDLHTAVTGPVLDDLFLSPVSFVTCL